MSMGMPVPAPLWAQPAMAGLFLCLAPAAWANVIEGVASRIVDGDTLYVCNQTVCEKVRLCGIDAPERADARGAASTATLKVIALNKELRCVRVGEGTVCDGRSKPTNRDRVVAQCFLGKQDLAATMVERGQACDWIKFSGGHYSLSAEACSK